MQRLSETELANEAARRESARFFRWALPLAAAIALSVGGLWWVITLRQAAAPVTRLRDGAREILLEQDGRTPAFAELPPALRDAVRETLRTGKFGSTAEVSGEGELEAAQRLAKNSHLVLGVANARAGLRAEAAREFALFAQENPQSPLARQLLEEAGKPRANETQ